MAELRGAGGTPGGLGEFLIERTSLFNTLLMLVLLVGGIGLMARGVRAHT